MFCSLLLIGASAACAGMDKLAISNAVAEELTHEIRPGGVTQPAFWNANAMRFMYPPSIEFLPVAGATAYEMTVIDAVGRKFSWKSNDPVARLSPHWTELATGYVNLLVEALGAKGEYLGKTQGRFFWKKAAFTGNYPPAVRTYREAADRLYGYILDSAPLKYLAEHGTPDPDYPLNCYPTKIHSAVIGAMLNLAKRFPARADYAMKIARLSADKLLAGAAAPDTPLAGFTPTYEGKNLTAKDYAGQSMNLYPANAATAFLKMFKATGDAKYRDAAVRIGETYLRLQGKDGTWYLKQNFADGKPLCPNRAFPLGIARALVTLSDATGRADFRAAADRAFAYIENGPLKDWDWEGQFEDVVPMPKYSNLTKHSATDTAMFCLERFPRDKRRLAEARDVLRFAEDQFVEWERPFVGIGGRPLQWGVNAKLTWMMDETHIRKAVYPSVLEQYRCYVPISSSSSKLIRTYLALYRAEGKSLDLEKAKVLGDAMTRAQRPDGSIPTTLDPAAPYSGDWLNCLIADAAALNELAEVADLNVPENWAPKKIMGRDFVVGGVFWPGPASNRPDWAMYRLPSLTRTGWFDTVGLNDILWYRPMPEEKKFKALPYTVDAFFGPTNAWHGQRMREGVAAMERGKDSLYWVRITDSWFPWFMKDKYDCDKASYEEFVKTHKNFVSFGILNESDGSFGADFAGVKDPAIKAQMLRDFPFCKKPGDKQRRMAKAMERERAMHFGCSNFCSVYAQNCKWGHLLAKNGVRAWHEYEMEMNASSAPWAFGMFHARGVARQWGVPFTWYTAPLIIGFARDGQPCNDEWNCVRKGHEKTNLDCGGSISLVKRNCFYGFMGGAAGMEIENTDRCFFDTRDEKNPKPSKYALAFNEMAELCEKTVRGTPYTPVAALTSVWEDFYRFGYNKSGCRDAFAPNAFFFTLVPTLRDDPYRMSDRKKGDQGCLWNSEFGELCDVLCPDGGQPSEEFAKVLAPYKWAFLIGGFDDRKDYDLKSVEGWTKAGGTLVCSYDCVGRGTRPACPLVSEGMAGIQVVGECEKLNGGEWLCDAAGKKIEKFGEKYTFRAAVAKGAKPFLLDEKGTVVAYENAYGKGRVITVMAYQSIPDRLFNVNLPENEDAWFHKGMMSDVSSGRTQFPIQKHLLHLARDMTMPVKVEGDVQWGVNWVEQGGLRSCAAASVRAEGERGCAGAQPSPSQSNNPTIQPSNNSPHWLVWLINNKGVTKFEREEATIDHAFDAKVKITDRRTGKTVEKVVSAGGYVVVEL